MKLSAIAMVLICSVGWSHAAFEVVVFGDTQRYYQAESEGAPDLFSMQTSWVAENAVPENIVFLTHVGDVIQDNSGLWPRADAAMSLLDGVIPYSVTFGNHDGGSPNVFDASRYAGQSWYLGSSSDELAHAQMFTGDGITFLHINLPHIPNSAHLSWAQGIIDANPNRPTMISTHGYMADNSWGRSSAGNSIWNTLIDPNPQVFMTFNGHDWVTRHELNTTTDGRKIISMQTNWQQIINGGNGLFQRVVFDPDNSRISVKTYSPFLDLYHTDWTGEFAFSASFNGTSNITVNGETGPGHHTWTGGGSDNNWNTAGNWGGSLPAAGEVLRFKNTARQISSNNLPAGTSLAGMVFEPGTYSSGFNFSGNAIALTGDIVNMGGYGPATAQAGPTIHLPVTLVGARQFNTGDWDMTLSGVVSGNGSLTKTHGRDYIRGSYDGGVRIGDLYLTADNTYSGETRVTGGALVLQHSTSSNTISASPQITLYYKAVLKVTDLPNGNMVLADGQTLKGTGRVIGHMTAGSGATISPGHDHPGVLVQMGNLAMTSGSALEIEIGDPAADEYDQIRLDGQISFSGATLNLSRNGSYSPQIGDQIVMIDNDGADPVSGIMVSGAGASLPAGTALPEGALVSTNLFGSGRSARISYQGGDGNDLSLSILPPPGDPMFLSDPVAMADAEQDAPYHATIAGSAMDAEDDPLTYSKVSGPSWLVVAANGDLFGTPGVSNLGSNAFTVQVSDGNDGTDTATVNINVGDVKLVGQWDFDDADNLTTATVGADLVQSGAGIATMVGHTGSDGAVKINPGSHFAAIHGISPNGGGTYVNEWSLLLDFKYPVLGWISFFQTATGNNNDGDCFVRGGGGIPGSLGVLATGYGPAATQTDIWYRMVVSVKNGTHYKIYLDGAEYLNGTAQSIDGRFSLEPNLLLFADNNGEDGEIHVSSVRIYNKALTAEEIATLGTVGSGNAAPVFTSGTVNCSAATEKVAYTATIAGSATDADSDPLIYAMVSGPAWLHIATDGTLSGTPGNGDVGTGNWTVAASDGVSYPAQAELIITVQKDNDGDSIPDVVDPDDDNDQMPDEWETAHSLNTLLDDRAANPDGDAYDNWAEYVTDTLPQDHSSYQTFSLELLPGSGDPVLRFNSSAARNYTVEYRDDLTSGSWQDFGPTLPGTGSVMSAPDSAHASNRYYRLRVQLP